MIESWKKMFRKKMWKNDLNAFSGYRILPTHQATRSKQRIASLGTLTFVLTLLIGSSFLVATPTSSAASGYVVLCSSLPGGNNAGGIYQGTGGAFVEDWNNGNLLFCSNGRAKTIATVPAGGKSAGYYGMGGIKTSAHGVVLALTTNGLQGLWLCEHATSSGCGTKSSFIHLPASFCNAESAKLCNPQGAALDSILNLYYVDVQSQKLVECTAASKYQSCTNLPASSALTGLTPTGLFLQGSTFYISDASCTGNVWEGTRTSLHVAYSVGEEVYSVAVSSKNPTKSPHVYGGLSGFCLSNPASIQDLNDGMSLPVPFSSSSVIQGMDSLLQFTNFSPGAAYQTTDTV
jgi:hypothetical protein